MRGLDQGTCFAAQRNQRAAKVDQLMRETHLRDSLDEENGGDSWRRNDNPKESGAQRPV